MLNQLLSFVTWLPGEIVTIIVAMVPLAESQVAIPMALLTYKLPVVTAVLCAAIGGTLISAILLYTLGPITGLTIRYLPFTERFFDWLFARTRHRFVGTYEKYGLFALWIFVVIPGPGSGAWAGSLAAFLFGIPKIKALISIGTGLLVAAIIVALAATGVLSFLSWAVH